MATGTTNDFNYSRDQIINEALRKLGVLALEDNADAATLQQGIRALNGIIRALDLRNNNIWKLSINPYVVALAANVWQYTISGNMIEIVSANFRDATGVDYPLDVVDAKGYAAIQDKYETGDPEVVFLPVRQDISTTNQLLIWPAPASITTTSKVTGTDSIVYTCIKSHTTSSLTRPVTGASYKQYWTAIGGSGSAWADATDVVGGEQIHIIAKTPLTDFDLADDNADLPAGFGLYLIYRLANDWADNYGLPLEERLRLRQQMKDAYDEVFPYHVGSATDYHNRTRYM